MVGDPPWMEVIYSHSTFSDCTVWTCHCAQEDEDCTRPESMIRQRLGHVRHDTTGGDVYLHCPPLPPSFILRAIVLKGYLTSCPRMLLEEVTAQQLLSCGFIVASLCDSFGRFQNDCITFPTEWEEIKRLKSVDRPIVRSNTSLWSDLYFF